MGDRGGGDKGTDMPVSRDDAHNTPHWCYAVPSAGEVMYETANFMDKNKDFVVAEHQNLMNSSSLGFVAQLFFDPDSDTGEGHKTLRGGGGLRICKSGAAPLHQCCLAMPVASSFPWCFPM